MVNSNSCLLQSKFLRWYFFSSTILIISNSLFIMHDAKWNVQHFSNCLKVKFALIAVWTHDSFKITDPVFIVLSKWKLRSVISVFRIEYVQHNCLYDKQNRNLSNIMLWWYFASRPFGDRVLILFSSLTLFLVLLCLFCHEHIAVLVQFYAEVRHSI